MARDEKFCCFRGKPHFCTIHLLKNKQSWSFSMSDNGFSL
ncbi:hypothetical protein HMPREF0971_02371 [Segatella oris F0302]|uniref:Uncharacterized protein n=1 Tax=Segatella oris F0302 TaxID=649760 RepID=D1QTP2_9BACT|nr:hypothetical protein HMPREF0971_02371 [Segatella oris F0302]